MLTANPETKHFSSTNLSVTTSSRSACQSNSSSELSFQNTHGLYELVLEQGEISSKSSIIYGWWPRSSNWCLEQLVERTTRCLPAVRPNLDMVALPDLPQVHELWECWSQEHGLDHDQGIWFESYLAEKVPEDPAALVCRAVLSSAGSQAKSSGNLSFYPMYLTQEVVDEAAMRGIPVIGDAENHEVCPLSSAKAWLHPHITDDGKHCSSSLRDILPPQEKGVRGPRGYVASSLRALTVAWKRLQDECPEGTRFVLKPASGSGGCGIVLDVQLDDLTKFDFSSCGNAILEEMIVGTKPIKSPTLYMIGNNPCGLLADQVLLEDGVTNIGNKYPSSIRADMLTLCANAAQRLNKVWGLTSNWGLDFVINSDGDPIIVDLNMGRPNGNFAVRLWASRQRSPLSIFTGSYLVPAVDGPTIKEIQDALHEKSLLWNGWEGVIVYQHITGMESSFAVASAFGEKAMGNVLTRLCKVMLSRFGIKLSASV